MPKGEPVFCAASGQHFRGRGATLCSHSVSGLVCSHYFLPRGLLGVALIVIL